MDKQSQIIAASSKMEKVWREDVKGMAFAVADLSSILEILMMEDNPSNCIDQAPNLDDKLRRIACCLIDSCIPICRELERAKLARSATPKEETKLEEVAEVNEKSSAPSLNETDAPDLVPNVNTTVPDDEEEKEVSVSNIQDNEKENMPSHEAVLPALDPIILEKTNEEVTEPAEKEEKKLPETIIQRDQKSPEVDSKAKKAKKSVSNSATVPNKIDQKVSPDDVPTIILEKVIATVPEDKEKTKTSVEAVRETNPSLKVAINEDEFQVVSKKIKASKAKRLVPDSTNTVPKVVEIKKSFVDAVKVSAPVKSPQRVVIPIEKQNKAQVKLEVKVPAEKIGSVIGKLFGNIKRLESKHGVKVSLPVKGGSDILLTGPADNAAAAKEDILENLPWTTDYPLQKGYHGAIMGPKGEVINGLRKEHKVIIVLNHENVIIKGCKKQCDAALSSIKSIVAKQKEVLDARAAGIKP